MAEAPTEPQLSTASLNAYTAIDDTLVQSVGKWMILMPLKHGKPLVTDAKDKVNRQAKGSALLASTTVA